MINLLQYYSKTEYKFCKQTSFSNVNTNSDSLGLRKNVMFNNFGAKIWWENLTPVWMLGRGRHPHEDHTYQGEVCGPFGAVMGML